MRVTIAFKFGDQPHSITFYESESKNLLKALEEFSGFDSNPKVTFYYIEKSFGNKYYGWTIVRARIVAKLIKKWIETGDVGPDATVSIEDEELAKIRITKRLAHRQMIKNLANL